MRGIEWSVRRENHHTSRVDAGHFSFSLISDREQKKGDTIATTHAIQVETIQPSAPQFADQQTERERGNPSRVGECVMNIGETATLFVRFKWSKKLNIKTFGASDGSARVSSSRLVIRCWHHVLSSWWWWCRERDPTPASAAARAASERKRRDVQIAVELILPENI